MENKYASRIDDLRLIMSREGIDATIIPQADPHQSEYIAAHWQARRFLSGFNGSAGTLVVTGDDAALWTDSRYFLQAADQLKDTGITLMKEGIIDTPSIEQWLSAKLRPGSTVGINGMMFSADAVNSLSAQLDGASIKLDVNFAPLDELWTDRPSLPTCPIIVHDTKYAGESAADKISRILSLADRKGARSVLISPLDEIAWILNIRSRDVPYNPVATAFLYLDPQGSVIFTDPAKITPDVKRHLDANNISVEPYTAIGPFINDLPASARVYINPAQTAAAVATLLGHRKVTGPGLVAMPKACKNPTQVAGIRSAMIRDGVALVGAMMELEKKAAEGSLTELEVARIFLAHRSRQPLFYDESFGLIAGWGEHGAIVHYEADEQSDARITTDNLLLIDSGAQYLDGTTDITRTIAIGTPTPQQCTDFTLVMKGHIALANAVFPEGTHGLQLDALARQFLWRNGLTYLHGTGHGVGHFLNVHEGPQRIALIYQPAPLMPGMITSNEPGLYRAGQYGIRCENLTLVVEAMTTEFGRFFKFETLTLFPFDLRLFDLSIMTDAEINWVNNYHHTVFERLSPALDKKARAWLAEKTRPLTRNTQF